MPRVLLFCAVLIFGASRVDAIRADSTLFEGVRACRAGKLDSAIALLSKSSDNPYLDALRLYYRADCLVRDSMYRDAAAEIETLFALAEEGAIDKSHGVIERARSLYAEALAGSGACVPDRLLNAAGDRSPLTARAAFLASRACFAAGDTSAALRFFLSGISSKPASADTALFRSLIQRYEGLFPRIGNRTLGSIACSAAALRLDREADFIVEYLLAKDPEDYDALFCKRNVLSLIGAHERALRLCWRLFYSSAPVFMKEASLFDAASIEYRLKQYDKAAKHFLMYGTYYPKSERAPSALDTAARIYVLQKDWSKALAVWETLRSRHRFNGNRMDAGVSEAVLRLRLGQKREARRILGDLLPRAHGRDAAAVFYWIMRTSASDSARAVWSDSLVRSYPRSFYAAIVRDGEDSLLSKANAAADRRRLKTLAGYMESRNASYDTVRADSAFERHPAFEAYLNLLEAGLGEEADMTAPSLLLMRNLVFAPAAGGSIGPHRAEAPPGAKPVPTKPICVEPVASRLLRLYAAAVLHGRDAFALSLLGRAGMRDTSGAFPWELRYPVPHASDVLREAESFGLSPLLVLAVMREESTFDPKAVSVDGARGLMQLLPSTASWMAARRDSCRIAPDDLFDPGRNIALGVRYIDYLLGRFNGSLIAALAAYNGGEGRMGTWNQLFQPGEDPLAAIEMIGPPETRHYVKKVLESLSAYRAMAAERGTQQ
jgi:tetratricopeptide (TPR) repeat protein